MPIEKLLGFRSRTFGISLTYFPKPPKKEVPRCIPTLSSGEWRDRSHIGATIWVSQPYDSYQNYNWTWIIYIYICWSQFWYIYIYIYMYVCMNYNGLYIYNTGYGPTAQQHFLPPILFNACPDARQEEVNRICHDLDTSNAAWAMSQKNKTWGTTEYLGFLGFMQIIDGT